MTRELNLESSALAAMSSEIVEWRQTGFLKQDGRLVDFAAQHFSQHGSASIRMAEDAVCLEVLKQFASPPAPAAAIKPLEWDEDGLAFWDDVGAHYRVSYRTGPRKWRLHAIGFPGRPAGGDFNTDVEARAAAQAHRDSIVSALIKAPPTVVVPEGVLKEVHFWLEGALTCKTWEWDGDQRGLAEDALQRLGTALAAAPEPPAAEAPGQEPVVMTVDDVEQIIISTESTESDAVWTRRMAKALHARLVSAPTTHADAEAKRAGRAFLEDLVKGFITMTSGDGDPYIKISYRTLKDAQGGYGLLIDAIRSLASPAPKGGA